MMDAPALFDNRAAANNDNLFHNRAGEQLGFTPEQQDFDNYSSSFTDVADNESDVVFSF